MKRVEIIVLIAGFALLGVTFAWAWNEAPAAFDNLSNGFTDDTTHAADRATFEQVETIADGLGPLFNAASCVECHQQPLSGGSSQVAELRVGHLDASGNFENPSIPINRGTEVITGRSLVNDRAICPSAQFPTTEIQGRVPESETIRTFRMSLNLLGDGLVEMVPDTTFYAIADEQAQGTLGIHGQVIVVPVVETACCGGTAGVGRFGWKDQHRSLLSFAADAYLNEMGITSRLFPKETTNLCNTAKEPNDANGSSFDDIDKFARFIRATKPPAPDATLLATDLAQRGSAVFDQIHCNVCHVRTMTTAQAGQDFNGGQLYVPFMLGNVDFHPFSDFLLHDIGTGDGIVQSFAEHYGPYGNPSSWPGVSSQAEFNATANKLRTAPLWGVRLRSRLMHDGLSLTFQNAIQRHQGEAAQVTQLFNALPYSDQDALVEFLKSL